MKTNKKRKAKRHLERHAKRQMARHTKINMNRTVKMKVKRNHEDKHGTAERKTKIHMKSKVKT